MVACRQPWEYTQSAIPNCSSTDLAVSPLIILPYLDTIQHRTYACVYTLVTYAVSFHASWQSKTHQANP